MHLRLDPLFQNDFAAGNDLLNVRAQLPRLRIDDLEFLLDTKRKNVMSFIGPGNEDRLDSHPQR